MAFDDNAGDPPVKDNSRNENVTTFLEVLRDAMGDSSLSDDELLEFARSDMFKNYFPDLVSGIPDLEEILNEESKNEETLVVEGDLVVEVKEKDDKNEESNKDASPDKDVQVIEQQPKKEKRVITLDISNSDSSVVALSDVPKDSKSAGSSKQVDAQSSTNVKVEKKDEDELIASTGKKEVKVEKKGKDEGDARDGKDEEDGRDRKMEMKKEKNEVDVKKERRDSTHSHSSKSKVKEEKDDGKKHSATSASTVVAVKKEKDHEFYEALEDVPRKQKNWKPFYDEDFNRYKKKFDLGTNMVILCDLQSFKSVFHGPDGADPSAPLFSSTIPLKPNMILPSEKLKLIGCVEKNKRITCARELKRKLAIRFKEEKKKKDLKKITVYSSSDSDDDEGFKKLINARKKRNIERKVEKKRKSESSDDERVTKKRKRNKRVLGSSSSDSDVPTTSKKIKTEEKAKKASEKKKEQKKSKKEEPVKIPPHLKWERKPDYFVQERDDKEITKKESSPRKIISVTDLLAKAEAQRRTAKEVPSSVPLKVPQNTSATPRFLPPQTSFNLSDISSNVMKILCSKNVIEIPVMGDVKHLYEMTVQKIAWWFLKWEQDPPKIEIIHPEHHDVVYEPQKDGYESDESVGHVSDPEGICKPVFDPKAIRDPDVADEYCGFHSLDCQMRIVMEGPPYPERFTNCFKTKPGTNYHRSTFQVKCHICGIIIHGARGLGEHIRSNAHANNFRNKSLAIADYSEYTEAAVSEKVFNATLKKYGQGDDCEPDLPDYLLKSLNPQPNSTLVSSAKVILDQTSSFFDIKEDPLLLEMKEAMTSKGKWTYHMDQQWIKASDGEKTIIKKYEDLKEKYKKKPEDHPEYAHEWNEFWYNRYDELNAANQDPENYDFTPAWNAVKVGTILRLVKANIETEINEMRKNVRMDYESLFKAMTSMGIRLEKKQHHVPSGFPVQATLTPYQANVNSQYLAIQPPLASVEHPLPFMARNMSPSPIQPISAPPLPVAAPPLPVAAPPLPEVPPPLPKSAPSPPKFSYTNLADLQRQIAEKKEKMARIEMRNKMRGEKERRTSKDEVGSKERENDLNKNRNVDVKKRSRSRSRERNRRNRSRSRDKGRRSKSKSRERSRRSSSRNRTKKRSRSRDRNRRRSRSRSRERNNRRRDRSRSRSHQRQSSKNHDGDRQRNEKDIRSVERGRTIEDNNRGESPISATSLDKGDCPYSPKSIDSSVKMQPGKKIPSLPVSEVSSNAFEIDPTKFSTFLAKLPGGSSKDKKSTADEALSQVSRGNVSVDNLSVEMELEDGEISPPPPGVDDYAVQNVKPVPKPVPPPPEITNKPMKRAPPPPILSGSNSLSSVSSGEPIQPFISALSASTSKPNVSIRGRGWTHSYRGAAHSTSSPNLNSGEKVTPRANTAFRGSILNRGAGSYLGNTAYGMGGSHMQMNYHTSAVPTSGKASHPSSYDSVNQYSAYYNPNQSQPLLPTPFPIVNPMEHENQTRDRNSYSDDMYPPSTPYPQW